MVTVPRVSGPQALPGTNGGARFTGQQAQAVSVNMPTPQYDTPQLRPRMRKGIQGDPSAVQAVKDPATGARQLMEFGQDLAQVGQTLAPIARDMQLQVNATITDDAINDVKELTTRMTYGAPDAQGKLAGGYKNIKGYDALNRPSGKALPDELVETFDEQVKAIADKKLKNDAQRRAFEAQVGTARAGVYQAASAHYANEFTEYGKSVYGARIDNTRAAVVADYSNAPALEKALEETDGAVAALATVTGTTSAEAIQAAQRVERSKTVAAVVEAAVTDQKFALAQAYLNKYGKQLDPSYLIKAKSLIDGEVAVQAGQQVATQLFQGEAAPAFDPSARTRLHGLIGQAESGNRDFDPKTGKLLEGPQTKYGTAKGRMQVLDGTNKDPGFGVRPARDDSPEERARVGRDYFDAMVVRYKGDLPKALAAYNWGPANLDNTLKNAANDGKDWRDYLPAETKDYVTKIVAAYDSGQGAPPPPSKADLYAAVDARIAEPKARQAAYARIDKLWTAQEEDKRNRAEDIYARSIQALDAVGGDYDALPAGLKSEIMARIPDKAEQLRTYGKGLVERKDTPTNSAAYLQLTDDNVLGRLSDQQFYAYRTQLSPGDWEGFAKHRAELKKGAAELNTGIVNSAIESNLLALGIPPKPKPLDTVNSQKVAEIQQFARAAVLTAQRDKGRKLTDDETLALVGRLFTREVKVRSVLFGRDVGEAGSVNILKAPKSVIPEGDMQRVKAALQANGVTKPTDAQIMGAWWRIRFMRGGQ